MIDWAGLDFVWRVGEAALNAITGKQPPLEIVRFDTRFEREQNRWACLIDAKNNGTSLVVLDVLTIVAPAGGVLRDDPPQILWTMGDDLGALRERNLGAPVSVLELGNEIEAESNSQFSFVVIPPHGWLGGAFRANLHFAVHGAKPTKVRKMLKTELTRRR